MGSALFGGELCYQRRYWLSKILIIFASCWKKVLASRGWEPILAESGSEALAKLECQIPRVILMDMQLPDISGFGLPATLKKHPVYRNIPILAATGFADDITRQRCLSAGCDDFISKPFAISVLERRLANLVSAETPKPIVATGLWPMTLPSSQ
jgi:two-component system, cell cycle response regulator DivK